MSRIFDIVVIGGGMAGFSAAAELAQTHKVCVVEREPQAGYHSTGRSAATFVPSYGPAAIQALAKASEAFFESAPNDFAAAPLLSPRGEVMMVGPGDEAHIAEGEALGLRPLPLDELKRKVPLMKTDALIAALSDDNARDLDVDLLLQGYMRLFKARGGTVADQNRGNRFYPALWRVAGADARRRFKLRHGCKRSRCMGHADCPAGKGATNRDHTQAPLCRAA